MADKDPTRSYLLWLLASRDYSRVQLEKKLRLRGLTQVEIRIALDAIFEAGLYNEESFKRARTRQLLKRGLGSYAVKAKLRADRLTLSNADIERGFQELNSSPGQELKNLVLKSLRKLSRGRASEDATKARARIVQNLMRKGHNAQDILRMIKSIEAEESAAAEA